MRLSVKPIKEKVCHIKQSYFYLKLLLYLLGIVETTIKKERKKLIYIFSIHNGLGEIQEVY